MLAHMQLEQAHLDSVCERDCHLAQADVSEDVTQHVDDCQRVHRGDLQTNIRKEGSAGEEKE